MVGQITGKMFDHPVRQVAGPESAAIQNLAALHCIALWLPRLRRGGAGVEGRILVYNFGEIELCPLLRGVNSSGQE